VRIKNAKLDGIEFLEKSKRDQWRCTVIMISGHGNIDTAVEAVKKGAFDISASRQILPPADNFTQRSG